MDDKKILVIADIPKISETVGDVLEGAGFGVMSAATSSQGVQAAIDLQPDAIVLDLRMQRGTATLALGFLQRSYRTRHIPVVVLDERKDPQRRQAAMASVRRAPLEPSHLVGGVKMALAFP